LIIAESHGKRLTAFDPEVARARTGQVLTIEAPAPGVGWP